MEDYLRVVIPYLHTELVNFQVLSQIQVLSQALLPSPIGFFECRLGDNQSQVDFQIGLSNATLHPFIEDFLAQSVWYTYRNFILDWVDSTSILHRYVHYIFLEFDVLEQFSHLPIPCLFLSLNQEASLEIQNLIELVVWKFNYSISPSLKSTLSHCFDSLPDGARVTHIGMMLSRSNKPVRLVVQGTNSQQLLNYLGKLGWTDVTTNRFSSIASDLEKFVDSFRLSFDVGDSIFHRVGLECFLFNQSYDKSRWQLLLNYLVEMDLCTPGKRNAILAWPGFSHKADAPELWPTNLAGGDLLLGSNAFSVFWREISHVKIVYHPAESSLSAKGYLSFGHSWLDVNLLTEKEALE